MDFGEWFDRATEDACELDGSGNRDDRFRRALATDLSARREVRAIQVTSLLAGNVLVSHGLPAL